MPTTMTGTKLATQRMNAADTRVFAQPGAGPTRRAAMARLTEDWLIATWERVVAANGISSVEPADGVALVAIGSLARQDCGPLSDLDLVLLHDGRMGQSRLTVLAEQLWYPLWDQGLGLDHSVRTLAECRQVAATNLPATMGLLDMRLIAGDPDLGAAARATLAHDWRAAARGRLPELLEGVTRRHDRHGELAQLLEPDLKESRGGLRDMRVLRALTTAWLADRPHGGIDAAYQRLLDVRDAVHVVTGRPRQKLQQQDQDAVAALLGLSDGDQVLREAYEAARVISAGLTATMRRAAQSQRARTLRVGPRRASLRPLGYGMYAHDGEAVLGPKTDPSASPLTALRAAAVAAHNDLPLANATVEHLARTVPALPTPWPVSARELLGELLACGPGLVPVWESLTLAGVVESWLPQWTTVRSHPQRNPIHLHTVDRHQVETVANAATVVADVHRPDLLLFACLVHDMGKATTGSDQHAARGAPVARRMAEAVGFPPEDAAVIQRLVAEHLTLIDLATRRDPRDSRTIEALCEAVGESVEQLELLRALTEADARAAGPGAWSRWRARLVEDLTGAARAALRGTVGADHAPAANPISEPTRQTVARYGAHVLVEPHEDGEVVQVTTPDRLGVFADLAGLLAVRGMSVRRAEATTVDGMAVDRWYVDSPAGSRVDAVALRQALRRVTNGDRSMFRSLTGRGTPASSTSPVTRALVLPDASTEATVLELRAADRPGLLYDIGVCLRELQVSIRSAYVATYAGQAVDTLYLTDFDGAVLSPPRVAQVIGALIDISQPSI